MKTECCSLEVMTEEELLDRMEKLARCYVPEWSFDRNNPDAGAVIAILIAKQMQENSARFARLPEVYHRELVRLLGLTPARPKPAHVVVLAEPTQDTAPGSFVPEGTKLTADGKGGEKIIFETAHDLFVSTAFLRTVFMRLSDGRIIPLQGSLRQLTPLGEVSQSGNKAWEGFRLFGGDESGIERNMLLIYHASLFDGEGQQTCLTIAGGGKLIEKIRGKAYRLCYYNGEGMRPVEQWEASEESLRFCLEQPCGRVKSEGREYALLAIEAGQPPQEDITAEDMRLYAEGGPLPPDIVYDGRRRQNTACFAPFGESLALYAECYIGQDVCFAKGGALVTLTMELSYLESEQGVNRRQEEEALKIIKRKPVTVAYDRMAETFAGEISIDYYDGRGWQPLVTKEPAQSLLDGTGSGCLTLHFICPADWKRSEAGGYEGRCMRIRLQRADNCYLRPCLHHAPVLRKMQFSYRHENGVQPEKLVCLAGTSRLELTEQLKSRKPMTLFRQESGQYDELLLGFKKRFERGPISLYLELAQQTPEAGREFVWEYSSSQGFQKLEVLDRTQQFSKSGSILFEPPADMECLELMSQSCCWLKVKQPAGGQKLRAPRIEKITLNAVEAANVETLAEEEFYVEEAAPNMVFPLRGEAILDADLWVSEERRLTDGQMAQIQGSAPQRVRAQYGEAGEIERFFVKWEEVDNFDLSGAQDRHYVLDRLHNLLCFGDGVHVRIPENTQESAFTVVLRCCRGQEGNVPAGAIHDSLSNLLFIGSVFNPRAAAGGSGRESMRSMLKRSAGVLGSRNRLISEADYVREAEAFSDAVQQAACSIQKSGAQGAQSCQILLALLLKDETPDDGFFEALQTQLKEYLLKRCEITVRENSLQIVEPFAARISVEAWLETQNAGESFALAARLERELEEYFNPVPDGGRKGWRIGSLPGKTQVLMKLNSAKGPSVIKQVAITVRYQDRNGFHEASLEEFQMTPLHVCRSGSHKIHVLKQEKRAGG